MLLGFFLNYISIEYLCMYIHTKYASLGSITSVKKKGTNKPKPQTVAKLLCQQIDSDRGNSNPGLLHVVSFISGSMWPDFSKSCSSQ